jgi:Tol biopolymer transport system component
MSMLDSACAKTGRWLWRTGSRLLAALALVVWGCVDDATQLPDAEFRADLAFIITPFEVSNGSAAEVWVASLEGPVHGIFRQPGCLPGSPAISPDGLRLALRTCGEGGFSDILIVTAEGRDPHYVTRTLQPEDNPRWSPDGSKLAFEALRGGLWVLCVIDPDSGAETIVASSASPLILGDWSNDGKSLVFGEHDDLWTVSLASQARTQLTFGAGGKRGPVWSPADDSIAFLKERSLCLVDRQGRGGREIPVEADSLVPPLALSYDGTFFLVTGWAGGRPDILRVMRDGSSVANLTRPLSPGSSPVLLPDRRQFAYVADLISVRRIFLMDTEGFSNRMLTQVSWNESSPAARRLRLSVSGGK